MRTPSRSGEPPLAYVVADAAAMSGLSRGTIYNAIKAGRLLTVRVGGRRLVHRQALLDFLQIGAEPQQFEDPRPRSANGVFVKHAKSPAIDDAAPQSNGNLTKSNRESSNPVASRDATQKAKGNAIRKRKTRPRVNGNRASCPIENWQS
jgi:excisionase family DNA binding protein